MPYPQDLEGKYINYRVDQGEADPAVVSLRHGILRKVTSRANAAVYSAISSPGENALHIQEKLAPWTFKFLKYYAGIVTVTSLGTPVMSGPMSGCFLCRYTRKGQHIAHIGTAHTPTDEKSIAAKASWLGFAGRADVTAITGGSPVDCFSIGEFQTAMATAGGMAPNVVGYFAGGNAYAILLAPVSTRLTAKMPGVNLMYVAKVKTMLMRPWAAIAATPKFR